MLHEPGIQPVIFAIVHLQKHADTYFSVKFEPPVLSYYLFSLAEVKKVVQVALHTLTLTYP